MSHCIAKLQFQFIAWAWTFSASWTKNNNKSFDKFVCSLCRWRMFRFWWQTNDITYYDFWHETQSRWYRRTTSLFFCFWVNSPFNLLPRTNTSFFFFSNALTNLIRILFIQQSINVDVAECNECVMIDSVEWSIDRTQPSTACCLNWYFGHLRNNRMNVRICCGIPLNKQPKPYWMMANRKSQWLDISRNKSVAWWNHTVNFYATCVCLQLQFTEQHIRHRCDRCGTSETMPMINLNAIVCEKYNYYYRLKP